MCKSTIVCALAFLQTISAQIIAGPYAAIPNGVAGLAASNGGGLSVISSSPIAPTGVTLVSENIYDGILAVSGAAPFLGAVALEGALPTAGSGAVTYGCGSGAVAMLSEDYAPYAYDGWMDGFAAPTYSSMAGFGYIGPLGYGFA